MQLGTKSWFLRRIDACIAMEESVSPLASSMFWLFSTVSVRESFG